MESCGEVFWDAQSECDDVPRPEWLDGLVDLFPVDGEAEDQPDFDAEGHKRYIDITVDSGAGLPVANPKHFPGAKVVPSAGSRRGQQFMGPGGDLIANQGQMSPEMLIESGDVGRINFAAAEVRKPLLAVSAINARGSPVWFDGADSFILPKGSALLPDIRALIKQIKAKIGLHQTRGTYTMKAWHKPSGPFHGPGW